ncbi:MAG: HDOD domain-containing protein [Methylotenera sp.]|uniref:HDOD domain-containing protein n=1 Tax=Methylotenera sp. TaxID=2051956 RepID=UPI0024893341|nr:HDOD domain-containing protein [Methylotenera sp.]MDI1310170.1 HDOD domain-containing protein [Methylotenera sp.]
MAITDTNNTSALESLLRRMRSNEDFPALSTTFSEINNAVSSDLSSTLSLTKIILQDFSLTNKLLKIVNTVSYGQFGGKISTISKAVVILGFDVVRDIATTLILIDFLQNKSQATQLTDQVIFSFFSGLTARQLTYNLHKQNHEEAMICGIFHHLGQLLTTFYFFDESQKINQLISDGIPPKLASIKVLGISYDDLGNGVAKSWNFPSRLLHGMQALPNIKVGNSTNELDQLNVTVNLASELTAIVSSISIEDKNVAIGQLVKKYRNAIQIDEKLLHETLEQSLQEMAIRAKILNIAIKKSLFLKRISEYTNKALKDQNQTAHDEANANKEAKQTKEDFEHSAELSESNEKIDSESILQAGIQEVMNTLVSDYKLNDVLQMILETMYRGMGCNRVLMLVRDAKTNLMQARSGYGEDTEKILLAFKFPLHSTPDVFYLAADTGADIVIEDTDSESIAAKIPLWYKKISSAKSFLLLPVMINKKAVGCFYVDMQTTHAFDEKSKNLSLLRTLRNQAVLAIKQSQ